jgi:hypothetical protein
MKPARRVAVIATDAFTFTEWANHEAPYRFAADLLEGLAAFGRPARFTDGTEAHPFLDEADVAGLHFDETIRLEERR